MFIVGIEPRSPGLHIFSGSRIPRLGLPLLLTMARDMGCQVEMYCEEIAPIVWERIEQADIICISSITSTIPRAFQLIEKIRKEHNANAPILIGGPHVTFLPDEALSHGADFVFRHEADDSFVQFLQWWSTTRDPQELFSIPELSFKVGNQHRHNRRQSPGTWVDLDALPTPDLHLVHGFDAPKVIPLITSRGCPMDCEFCSEFEMFGHRYRFRSPQKVLADIRFYDRRYGRTPIFIADDNLAANPARLETLCDSLVANRLSRPFSGQVRLDLAKRPQTLAKMSQAGFDRVFIGYESVNQDSLDAMGKRLVAADMEAHTKAFHRFRIAVHSMWVLGFDHDTVETIKATIRSCIKWGIETTQFLILVPIPGSRLYQRFLKEGRIFEDDWSMYDGHHVTFRPKGMTARQLQIAVMLDAMPKAYNLWQTFKLLIRTNLRTALGVITRRTRHPIINLKANLTTFVARLLGRVAISKIKPHLREYLKSID